LPTHICTVAHVLAEHSNDLDAAYGFIASVLPVWDAALPRDYLSSYLKIGTILS